VRNIDRADAELLREAFHLDPDEEG
jgi:hypothetical protein